jgi:2-keto-4-pentenoate hydratase/2-oxohepta-3-ene-1,7-dioic acid hydratase in catechol pathway
MKLVTFKAQGAAPAIGAVVEGERVVPLPLARNMLDLIARWPALEGEARRLAAAAAGALPLGEVTLLAPIPRPGKIMAIGLNYADHIAETGAKTPEFQTWFSKAVTAAHGPFAPIQIPKASAAVDYEAELVVVIGGGGRHVAHAAAPAAVFGFCCGNDVSVRDWQMRSGQWVIGKSFDTHAPFGPWITTADEVPDPHALGIRCFVNGEKRQDSNTRHLVFDVWAEIEHLSQAMTLESGDLIFTGTPSGVAAAMRPPQFLKSGDVVRVEIDTLGALEATMEAEA